METIIELLSQAMASFADYRMNYHHEDYDIGMQRLLLARKLMQKQNPEACQCIDPCACEGCD